MFQVFSRSWKGLNLSPGERAAMKLTEGVLVTAVGSGVLVAVQQVTTGNINVHEIALLAGGSAFGTLYGTVKKYLASQTDVPLAEPSLAGPPVEMPQAVQLPSPPPLPVPPGLQFTTQVPLPASAFIPMPQAGGTYVPPPQFDRNWSDLMPSVASQATLPQVPTP